MKGILLVILISVMVSIPSLNARKKYDVSKVQYIDNGTIRLGVSTDLGGAITYIADPKTGKNMINKWDWGVRIRFMKWMSIST